MHLFCPIKFTFETIKNYTQHGFSQQIGGYNFLLYYNDLIPQFYF